MLYQQFRQLRLVKQSSGPCLAAGNVDTVFAPPGAGCIEEQFAEKGAIEFRECSAASGRKGPPRNKRAPCRDVNKVTLVDDFVGRNTQSRKAFLTVSRL